jgi:polysaccharide export outer membrane protein
MHASPRSPSASHSPSRRAAGWLAASLLVAAPAFMADVATAQQPTDYMLQPGDQLDISVWREEELQREIIVRPDGKFSFPLTGEVVAVNRSVAEIQQEITEKLERYIPEAVVTVTVTAVGGNRIYVIGQVREPGSFVMNPQINVLQALSLAGGTTAFASLNDIIVLRRSGGSQRILNFRYNDISRGRDLDQNILLEAGDVLIVP